MLLESLKMNIKKNQKKLVKNLEMIEKTSNFVLWLRDKPTQSLKI